MARQEAATTTIMQLAERPDVQAFVESVKSDREAMGRWQADAPRQQRRLEQAGWFFVAKSPIGLGSWQHYDKGVRLLHSVMRQPDGKLWSHMSLSRSDHQLPSWEQLRDTHWLLYPSLNGVVVCAPASQHYSLAEVMHMWTCLDGSPVPDFRIAGAI